MKLKTIVGKRTETGAGREIEGEERLSAILLCVHPATSELWSEYGELRSAVVRNKCLLREGGEGNT